MSKFTDPQRSSRPTLGFALVRFALAMLLLVAGCAEAERRDRAAAPDPTEPSPDLLGTWVHARGSGEGDPSGKGARFKFRTGQHWNLSWADPESGLVIEHDGGTYTLNGDIYVETFEYATERTAGYIGRRFTFRVVVEGDTMTQIGLDNPYTEVWKRVR